MCDMSVMGGIGILHWNCGSLAYPPASGLRGRMSAHGGGVPPCAEKAGLATRLPIKEPASKRRTVPFKRWTRDGMLRPPAVAVVVLLAEMRVLPLISISFYKF